MVYSRFMDVTAALIDSWERQCRIVTAMAGLVTEETRGLKPSDDGWSLDKQLAHIHLVRRYWLSQIAPERGKGLPESFVDGRETPIDDLEAIKGMLAESGEAVGSAVKELIEAGGAPAGGYDNPVLFLQHMVWHEGWHLGLISLALRRGGREIPEEWEEEKIWSEWRIEEWD